MLVSGNDILELIPQRAPIVMIDKLLYSDNQRTVSGLTVIDSNIFCKDGIMSENGLVENIAQTAAAGVGYVCKTEKKPVPIGFIAAIKDLEITELPKVGAELETEVVIQNQIMDVTIVGGRITSNGKELVKCEMRIFIKPE